jgi:hypothetical protein
MNIDELLDTDDGPIQLLGPGDVFAFVLEKANAT